MWTLFDWKLKDVQKLSIPGCQKKSGVLDREATKSLVLQVVASDSAPVGSRKSTTVPVNVTVADENDNPPLFVQKDYAATIVDNIPFYPDPSPIVQVLKPRFSPKFARKKASTHISKISHFAEQAHIPQENIIFKACFDIITFFRREMEFKGKIMCVSLWRSITLL